MQKIILELKETIISCRKQLSVAGKIFNELEEIIITCELWS